AEIVAGETLPLAAPPNDHDIGLVAGPSSFVEHVRTFGEITQLGGAFTRDAWRNVIRKLRRRGAGARRIRKDMNVGEREPIEHRDGGRVILVRFARESADQVGA